MTRDEAIIYRKLLFCMVIAAAIAAIILNVTTIVIESDTIAQLEVAVSNDYEFYLDGTLVDVNTIELSYYRAKVNHEEKIVKLTKKMPMNRGNYNYVPVIVH